jgi:hypothetical protein
MGSVVVHFQEDRDKKAFITHFLTSRLPEEEFTNQRHKGMVVEIMKLIPGFHPDFGNTIMMAIGLKEIFGADQDRVLALIKNRHIEQALIEYILECGFMRELEEKGLVRVELFDTDPTVSKH